MLRSMTETPEKSPLEPPELPDRQEGDDSADPERDTIALPSHIAGSATLDRLIEAARDYARQAASENTLKAYAKDWAHFARWCRMRGADPLPPSSQLIGLYIADLAAPGGTTPSQSAFRPLAVSSIERRISGLTWGYAQRGERLDRKDRHIATVLAGIRRRHARPPVQKEAILPEDLRDMLATLPHDLRGLRDRAILLIGFAGGLRRSEIVSLDHGKDDTPDSGGWVEILEDGVLLTLRGKTGWREVEIARGSSDQTCPVHALNQWLHYARIDFGPLFVAVSRNGRKATGERLSDKHVARLIKQTVEEAGLRPELSKAERLALYSGHSLRAGLASSAEVDERYVQKQLGHASAEMTRRYQRRRDRFRVNLTKAAGL
ncbi:tyrosine-type recombinase/integrase [uncultured Paracoccus sp.]|jgi:integrase|uniref:tyrosine-type recombinase/integrase n=1 Tax=uncultured Paracoccus sp. TaxID=189685 RepID=UPI00261FAC22|nr:tyrosine-type recombinase/integrase [uncultured Paracoccus sp.]